MGNKRANRKASQLRQRHTVINIFGNFGVGNFGNDITFEAILYHLRRLLPDVEVRSVCTGPACNAIAQNVRVLPMTPTVMDRWQPQNRIAKALRTALIGVPSELWRWINALLTLRDTDAFIVAGTGLLTDAYGLKNWGPYGLFKWSLSAKLCGCKLIFVSVGGGPIYSRAGSWLVRSALALADFRSYRDAETKEYFRSLGAGAPGDTVYPDLAFSIVEEIKPLSARRANRRPVVGLGLMLYHSRLSGDDNRAHTYTRYLEQIFRFARWLLAQGYDIRLLIGDLSDKPVVAEFKRMLEDRLDGFDIERIIDEPVLSVRDLLEQLDHTDAVVATRFHNILLALALNKPVLSISFHQKCTSLMHSMGLEEYCHDIKELNAEKLIAQFCELENRKVEVKKMIGEKVMHCRRALYDQYEIIHQQYISFDRANMMATARP